MLKGVGRGHNVSRGIWGKPRQRRFILASILGNHNNFLFFGGVEAGIRIYMAEAKKKGLQPCERLGSVVLAVSRVQKVVFGAKRPVGVFRQRQTTWRSHAAQQRSIPSDFEVVETQQLIAASVQAALGADGVLRVEGFRDRREGTPCPNVCLPSMPTAKRWRRPGKS